MGRLISPGENLNDSKNHLDSIKTTNSIKTIDFEDTTEGPFITITKGLYNCGNICLFKYIKND